MPEDGAAWSSLVGGPSGGGGKGVILHDQAEAPYISLGLGTEGAEPSLHCLPSCGRACTHFWEGPERKPPAPK